MHSRDNDEEPLATKRIRRHRQKRIPNWRKCEPIYSSQPEVVSNVDQRKAALTAAFL